MPRPFSEERIVSSIHVARKTGYLHAKGWTWIPIITYINIMWTTWYVIVLIFLSNIRQYKFIKIVTFLEFPNDFPVLFQTVPSFLALILNLYLPSFTWGSYMHSLQ